MKKLLLSIKYRKWNQRLETGSGILDRDELVNKFSERVKYYDQAEKLTFDPTKIHFHNCAEGDQQLKFVELLTADQLEIPQPFTLTIKNAHIIGYMAVAMVDDEIILESTYNSIWYLNKTGDAKFIMKRGRLPHNQLPFHRAISLVSILNTNYFFWLTNFLPLLQPHLKDLRSDPSFKVLLNPGGPNFQQESLAYLGLVDNIYWWSETSAQIDELYITSYRNSFVPYGNGESIQLISPTTIHWLREMFTNSHIELETYDAIYISRNKSSGRNLLNEKELDSIFKKHDIKKIFLEDFPFITQVQLLAKARNIITPHGAGLTNLLFSTKASIFELYPDNWTLNRSNIYQLSCMLDHTYHFYLLPAENKDLDMILPEKLLDSIIDQFQ